MKRGQIILLAIGIFAGYWLAKHGSPFHLPHFHHHRLGSAEKEEITPSVKGEMWLDDFENADINKRWKRRGVVATQAEEHVTHGHASAKVTFDNSEGPSFAMEDYMNDDGRRRNWKGYQQLSFDIYNAQSGQERVLLQLKDKDGRAYKEDIVINGKASQHISVRLEDLKELLNLSRMDQVNLFRWKPKKPSTFYVDAIRLEPPSSAAAKTAAPSKPAVVVKDIWQVGWASALEKLQRDPAKFTGKLVGPVQMSLAGGEYESVQVALIGGKESTRVNISVGELANAEGTVKFPSDVVEIRRVGYVTTHEPYYPVTYVGDWPDPLPLITEEGVDVPAEQVQPVWITIGAPPSLPSGKYLSTITITEQSGRIEHLPLEVTVRNFVLPTTSHLKTAFDFYRFRLEKAYREFVPGGAAWQGRMGELENLYFLDMIKHRIMPVMQTDPSSSRFNHELNYYLRAGLVDFGIGTRGGSNGNNWPKEPQALDGAMSWYRRAAQALRSQDLLKQAYVYTYDEPKPGDPHVAQVMEAIHSADPELRNLLVMDEAPDPVRHAAWLKDADILCIRVSSYDVEQAKQYTQLGKEMWLYVSSPAHPFPALVIDYPSISHRIIPWMCWKYGVKGFLYWCVNFWNGDPFQDPANYTKDQNGNGSLYYPTAEGPVPSIRMEVLRDGMEDYEYFFLLNELVNQAKDKVGIDPALLSQGEKLLGVDSSLVASLRSYSKDNQQLLSQRDQIAETIEKLQAALTAPAAPKN